MKNAPLNTTNDSQNTATDRTKLQELLKQNGESVPELLKRLNSTLEAIEAYHKIFIENANFEAHIKQATLHPFTAKILKELPSLQEVAKKFRTLSFTESSHSTRPKMR